MKPTDPKQNRMSRKLESTQVSADINFAASNNMRVDSVATDAGFGSSFIESASYDTTKSTDDINDKG